jgi:hypothetical protein
VNIATLDALEASPNPSVTWLEEARGFARWAIGPEDSEWFCLSCGTRVDDPADGCDYCGEGQGHDPDETDEKDETDTTDTTEEDAQ